MIQIALPHRYTNEKNTDKEVAVLQIGAEATRSYMCIEMAVGENDAGIMKDYMDGFDAVLNKLALRRK